MDEVDAATGHKIRRGGLNNQLQTSDDGIGTVEPVDKVLFGNSIVHVDRQLEEILVTGEE